MPSHRNLQNHTVAVTGASSGIGASATSSTTTPSA